MKNQFFNAHHSPVGAFASFTLGFPGKCGGFDLEQARPPKQNIYIGLESTQGGTYDTFPFYEQPEEDESQRYDIENPDPNKNRPKLLFPYAKEAIQRDFQVGTDTWKSGDLTFSLISPVQAVPDPKTATDEELRLALVPAVLATITVDNSKGTAPRRMVFGYQGTDPYSTMRRLDDTMEGAAGVGQGRITAIVTRDPEVRSGMHFRIEDILNFKLVENLTFGLGAVGALFADTPAGEIKTYRFAICFHRSGIVTAGRDASYMYARLFKNIEAVADYALGHFDQIAKLAQDSNARISGSQLSDDQKFMLAHAIRSYYGSTQLLDMDDEPFWVVNEGEYRMINTFDLTVDQLFYELAMNPWTVRNELDMFVKRYSYEDRVRFPGDDVEYPGGISFTHDMGVGNTLSRPGYSSYELYGIDDCFSHMTHEQLVNWTLCGATYVTHTNDQAWLQANLSIFDKCLTSMINRDHPNPELRNGVMSLDSTRTMGGAEITTYDSLDVSLGQARNNIYLAGKCWAAYVAMERIFAENGREDLALIAGEQAMKCARTLTSYVTEGGYIPAVVGEGNDSKIIPAIEGLVFPYFTGNQAALDEQGRYGFYITALKKHLDVVLVEGICLFEDGGWKLSSTSNNSWLSKIYLCQFVAREILGLVWDEKGAAADAAHVAWLTHPTLSIYSWSDQIISGEITGSKYYPRGVTSILWLLEGK
ncbi:glycoside hydrolase family 52 protein [Paenibacillus roseipurpureus]|uniref:Glycoside hydrolase family 52 protein n=1 Tax=Paenibacillus roseopurpureus TaxID=2918901 RepID=A0AA96RIG8_9BACL|nr:glycoside hydrolase family 52 protein [Paenibacillus sp. MBLB1832]WNR42096.1 glycoside hydrolase family 52 protein [Paenibacillus sp. MBLB1832]